MDGQDNIIDAEENFEIVALRREIENLNKELTKYKILLKEFNEDIDVSSVSDEEAICVEQIAKLKKLSSKGDLSTDEVKKFDLLHKNLKIARNQNPRAGAKSKADKMSVKELTNIARK